MKFLNDIKTFPRQLWILMLSVFVNRLGTMAVIFLTLYVTRELGHSPGEAGLVVAVYGIGSLIIGPFAGKLSDRFGELRLVKISVIAGGFMLLLFPFINNYYLIIVYTFLWSLVAESFRPASMSYISKSVEPKMMKTAFAINRLAINLGMSVGPLLGGFLSVINFDLVFWVDGSTAIISGLILVIAKLPKTTLNEKATETDNVQLNKVDLPPIKNYRFIGFLLVLLPVEMLFFQLLSTYPLYIVNECGIEQEMFGLLHSINTIIIIFLEVPLNNAMKGWNDSKAMALGAFLFAVGFGSMFFADTFFTLTITLIIWTFGEMILLPASSTFVADIAPQKNVGEYMGYYQMSFGFSWTVGPWAGTLVYEKFGAGILWITTFVLGMLSTAGFLGLAYKTKKPKNPA